MVAAGDAFLVGYREQADTDATLHVLRFSDAGQLSFESHFVEKCLQPMTSDGVSFSAGPAQTTLIASLPAICGQSTGAGAAIALIGANGSIGAVGAPKNPAFSDLHISSRALAPAGPGHLFAYVAFIPQPVAQLALIEGTVIQGAPPILELFSATDVRLATGDGFVAITATTATNSLLQVRHLDISNDPSIVMLDEQLPAADRVDVAASELSAVVLEVHSSGPLLRRVQVGDASADVSPPFPIGGGGTVDAAATFHHADPFVAIVEPQGIRVGRYEVNEPSVSVNIATPVPPDTRVAIAGSDRRLAVAWLRAAELSAGTSPGGWAVLQCAE